jgi:prolyl-tRNA synthetase
MRWREFLIPTTKETPKDAAVASHVLMLRAGLIRPVMTGVYSYLPLGWRVLRKVQSVIREEMDRAGAVELHTPALQPLAWAEVASVAVDTREAPLRLAGPADDWRLQSVLAARHEAAMTEIAKGYLKSYKQLPATLYHTGSAFCGEDRPKDGLLCTRESLTAEVYSFHAERDGLDGGYEKMRDACVRALRRCGLAFVVCDGEPGPRGSIAVQALMVLSEAGEERVAMTDELRYAADARWARSDDPAPAPDVALDPLREVHTPGAGRVADVCGVLGTRPAQMIKTLIYVGREVAQIQPVVALVRGDHEVNTHKLSRLAGTALELADPATIEQLTGAAVGFAGPHGLADSVDKLIVDPYVAVMRNAASGANRTDYHVTGLNPGRDFPLEGNRVVVADIRNVVDGDPSPTGGGPLRIKPAIAVARAVKLGTKCSRAMKATFLSKGGKRRPFVMGRYTINLDRVVAAAIESHHDDNGIIWPMSIAPFQALVLALDPRDEQVMQTAAEIHDRLDAAGVEVLLDDRDERAGFKFKDADLIGIPLRIIVGKRGLSNGVVEINHRRDAEKRPFAPPAAIDHVLKLAGAELARLS